MKSETVTETDTDTNTVTEPEPDTGNREPETDCKPVTANRNG